MGAKVIFEEIMQRIFWNCYQATNLKSSVNPKDNKYWECQNPSTEHIIVKLLKIKDKKKFWKANRKMGTLPSRRQ